MADLLECLVQIRALALSPERVAALAGRYPEAAWRRSPAAGVWTPLEVLGHLAGAELLLAARLDAMLARHAPALAAAPNGADGAAGAASLARSVASFAERRAATVARLGACSADDLERTGVHPARGPITIADLVAIALAHDTDHIGQIRRRLGDDRNE